jgi:Glycosyl hydrolase catalytic core
MAEIRAIRVVVLGLALAVACSSHATPDAVGGSPSAADSGSSSAGQQPGAAVGGSHSAAASGSAGGRAGTAGVAGVPSLVTHGSAGRGSPVDAGEDDAGRPPVSGGRSACKRGVGYGFDPDGATDDLSALAPGVSWYYGWANAPNAKLAKDYARIGVEFVPMIWGGDFNVDDVVNKIPDDARFLLGFNEPNFNSQANLTPQKAAALWPSLEQIAQRKHLALVSPAVNYCGGGCNVENPVDWMDQFFAACTNCQIDYVAVHWYACGGDALRSYIAMFKKYGKPIWLTEFSCGDSGTQPVTKQQSYMKEALAYLESDPDIFRYAWFSGRTKSIANVDLLAAPGKLSTLGQDYVSLPEPAACTQ